MKKILLAAMCGLFAACVHAGAPDAAPSVTATPVAGEISEAQRHAAEAFVAFTHGDYQVESFFNGPSGLMGLVTVNAQDQSRNIAWATADGRHFLLGAVVDDQGMNYTSDYAEKLGITLGLRTAVRNVDGSVNVSEAEAKALPGLAIDTTGTGPRDLYVVIDPMCPHCRDSYSDMAQPLFQKYLRVHWILATAVGGDQADQLIESKIEKKKTQLSTLMTVDRQDVEKRPVSTATAAYLAKTQHVLDAAVHQRAVPAVLYQEGGVWRAKTGFLPSDYLPPEALASANSKNAGAVVGGQAN